MMKNKLLFTSGLGELANLSGARWGSGAEVGTGARARGRVGDEVIARVGVK